MLKKSVFILVIVLAINLGLRDAKATTFDDGETHTIDWITNDSIYVYDNNIGIPTKVNLVDNGEIWGDFDVFDYSKITITGGYVYDDVIASDYATIIISGGLIGDGIRAHDNSRVIIKGGQIQGEQNDGGLRFIDGNSIVTIYGTGFNYAYGPIPDVTGTLTGTLLSGDAINWSFELSQQASIILIPEPCTLAFLVLGGLGLIRKRRL